MRIKKFLKVHHNLIISAIDIIQIINIFIDSKIVSILIVIIRNLMRKVDV